MPPSTHLLACWNEEKNCVEFPSCYKLFKIIKNRWGRKTGQESYNIVKVWTIKLIKLFFNDSEINDTLYEKKSIRF